MDQTQRVQRLLGTMVLAGVIAAGLTAVDVMAGATQHKHCSGGGCTENGCSANHPGFSCHVTDDDACNCVMPY